MANHHFTVEELMLDDTFISFCLQSNAADVIKWETIISSHSSFEPIITEAKHLVMLLHSGLSETEISNEIQTIQNKISLHHTAVVDYRDKPVIETISRPNERLVRNKWLYISIAASLFVCIFLFFQISNKHAAVTSQPLSYTVSSQSGSHKKILLPDGTEVVLNGNSNISWNDAFNKKDRHVKLAGSAFFKVAKNAQKPFVVRSGALYTTALGTAFYIRQLPLNDTIQVSMMEGKINVQEEKKNSRNIVYPGEEILFTAPSHSLQKQSFDTAILRHWIDGELSFSNVKFKEAINELSFWYNINIQLQNAALADKPVTGTYQDAPLNDVLKVLSFSLQFTYTVSGNTVIIH